MVRTKFNLQALRALRDFREFHFDLPARLLPVFHSHPANLKFKLVFKITKCDDISARLIIELTWTSGRSR